MDTEVLKKFLMELGFGVNDGEFAKFTKAVTSATAKVAALYTGTAVAAGGIAAGIAKISSSFEDIGYEYRILVPNLYKVIALRNALFESYRRAGVNLTAAVYSAYRLNISIQKTKFALEALVNGTASKFFPLLQKQSDQFRQRIYENMPKIQKFLESLVKSIFKALEAATELGLRAWKILQRVYNFFVLLNDKTHGWSTKILAAVAAWKFLNLAFINTPLGRLFALGLALITLYDDFMTFREGGRSLINWNSNLTKAITGAAGAAAIFFGVYKAYTIISKVTAALREMWIVQKLVTAAQWAFDLAAEANPYALIVTGIAAAITAIGFLIYKWDAIKKAFGSVFSDIEGFFSKFGGKIMDFVANPSLANFLPGGAPGGVVYGPPASAYNTATLHQQTNITVNQAADAQGTARHVSSEQNGVNSGLIRSMRPLTVPGGK